MNIEEYISSGILELYVLGQLSAEEVKEVEGMALKYPEIRSELLLIEETIEAMAQKAGIAPGPETRDIIFSKVYAGMNNDSDTASVPLKPGTSAQASTGFRRMKFALAASIALAALSSILAVIYWNKWQHSKDRLEETETELNDLIAENQEIAKNFHQTSNDLNKLKSDFEIIRSKSYRQIPMEGLDIAPSAIARIYWSEDTKEVYLDAENLPESPIDKQFQLWAIVDGKPVSAGVFDTNGGAGLKRMKDISNASAFAVTLEPKGGSESPTMELMYVYGEVKKS